MDDGAKEWEALASSAGPAAAAAAAAALLRRHRGPIALAQAAALVSALEACRGGGPQQEEAWPPMLGLLSRWAHGLRSGAAAAAAAPPQRRPLPARPWERAGPQGGTPGPPLPQQQQQQPQQPQPGPAPPGQQPDGAASEALLQRAVGTVAAALQAGGTSSGCLAPPCLEFLGAAVVAPAGGASRELRQLASAAACAGVGAAVRPELVADAMALSRLLWGFQRLAVACQVDEQQLAWLFSCLLLALCEALPASFAQQQHQHQQPAGSHGSSHLALQDWEAQQAQRLAELQLASALGGLQALGQHVGLSLCRSAEAAAESNAASDSDDTAAALGLRSLSRLAGLLLAAASEGDTALAVLAAAAAAGLVSGCLEALPPAAWDQGWAAVAATSWGAAAPQPSQQQQQHGSSRWRQPHTRQRQHQQQERQLATGEPQLPPNWEQQLQQQALLLAEALSAGCRAAVLRGDSPGSCFARTLLGHGYAKLMATHGKALQQLCEQEQHWLQQQQQHWQQQQRLQEQLPGLLCSTAYVLEQCCGLDGVLHHAGGRGDAAAANAWLQQHQLQHPPHEVGLLVRWLSEAAALLPAQDLAGLLATLRGSAARLARGYSRYLAAAGPQVLARVDAAAARQQLDRAFALHVAVLAAAWQRAGAPAAAAAAGGGAERPPQPGDGPRRGAVALLVAQGLADLAELQFCQVQLPAYVDLLHGLVAALSRSCEAADAFLASALPCYAELLQPAAAASWRGQQQQEQQQQHAAEGGGGSAPPRAWLADHVLVAKLAFLLPLIPVACKAASDQAAAVDAVLPLLMLLLPHAVQQVSAAAHAAFAGLFAVAAPDPGQQEKQAPAALARLEQALPYYVQRALEAAPGSSEGLALGFTSALRGLPPGSAAALLAARRIAERAVQLAQQPQSGAEATMAASLPAAPLQQQQEPGAPAAPACDRLFELLQLAVRCADYELLPGLLDVVAAAVLGAPPPARRRWLGGLYDTCLAVDDYTRKPGLMAWVDGLAACAGEPALPPPPPILPACD